MTDSKRRGPFFWERDDMPPPGEHLAALRRGFDRPPGSVPAMWQFYTRLHSSGVMTPGLVAEHQALSLFGLHQQGEGQSVHRAGQSVGEAAALLRISERYSPEAIEQRFTAAATATGVSEMTHHLRFLVQLMKAVTPTIGFDYTRLYWDLVAWQAPDDRPDVQRRWGAAFFWTRKPDQDSKTTTERKNTQ